MPEGDTLHRIARRLAALVGEQVQASAPHPRGSVVARAVDGRVLEAVDAVGKHLLLRFEGDVAVRSHLGMNGRWRVDRADAPLRGRPWLVLRGRTVAATQWNGSVLTLDDGAAARLGPDLLCDSVDVGHVARRVTRAEPSRPLGDVLLDQRLVAGIGNMWLAELLWQARLSPWLPVGQVGEEELTAALDWAREAMRGSVAGDRPSRAVYRRAGRPCQRCATPIRSRGLGDWNRTAYWCPTCQVTHSQAVS